MATLSYSLTKSPKVTGKSTAVSELNGSTPSESSSRATMIAKLRESSPHSMSFRSSPRGARIHLASTRSNCDWTVDLTDMLLAPLGAGRVVYRFGVACRGPLAWGAAMPVPAVGRPILARCGCSSPLSAFCEKPRGRRTRGSEAALSRAYATATSLSASLLAASGRVMETASPPPCALRASIAPPCRVTARAAIASPSPSPPPVR